MHIDLILATAAQHDTLLRNLYQFYLYEFSRFSDEWRVQADGRFAEDDLEDCWEDDHRRIFLIQADGAWAGFVIVDLDLPDPDGAVHELAEFFIMPPYRRLGLGEQVARQLFEQFKGRWELCVVETNHDALHFWRRILTRYTEGKFTETHRPEEHDYLHEFNNGYE